MKTKYISQITLDQAKEQLKTISSLEDGWDTYYGDGNRFSSELIGKSYCILNALEVYPFISPTKSNSIQMEFEKVNQDYLEIEMRENAVSIFYNLENKESEYSIKYDINYIAELVNKFSDGTL